MTLSEIVIDYKRNHFSHHEREITYFEKLSQIDEAIRFAVLSISPEKKRFSHQRRIPKVVLVDAYERLKRIKNQIIQVKNFDVLYDLIHEKILSVKGIGSLCVYDFSLRIGAYLKIEPNKVYLQAGALTGAKAFGFRIIDKKIQISDLPKEFRSLKASIVEDILCIYKNEFKGIGQSSKGC